MEREGFEVIERRQPSLLAGGILITGEVDRVTEFEHGMPQAHQAWDGKGWRHDPAVIDDQALVINVRGRGLVIITGCGHAGVVNIIRHAMRLTGIRELLALIGGFHLSGPAFEPVIAPTVAALTELAPELIVPGHCTGWRAQHTLATALPDAWVQTSVGTTYTPSAPRRVMPDPGSGDRRTVGSSASWPLDRAECSAHDQPHREPRCRRTTPRHPHHRRSQHCQRTTARRHPYGGFGTAPAMLLEAKTDLTAFADFPERHWKKIQSTNPLERVNREIKRRVYVVRIFPNPALERLTTAVLIAMHDEWIAFPRSYLSKDGMDSIYPTLEDHSDAVTVPRRSGREALDRHGKVAGAGQYGVGAGTAAGPPAPRTTSPGGTVRARPLRAPRGREVILS
ncbi:transposase [Streptomyces sp. NPDC059680]|uniref:MBL fold metallo-hydrolase n=1 Tax=Streptomyces sp. NPDC059680 TaxID=3346904 RepID=UPI00368C7CD9